MDPRDDKMTRSAFWCGVLQCDARPVAAGAAVRTVRGAYTASRPSEPEAEPESKRAGGAVKRASWPRRT
jgi:hypothetical protein